MSSPSLTAALVALLIPAANTAVTFGTSLKGQGFYCGHEQTAFQRGCTAEEAPCVMQHFWSGGFFPEYGASLLRYYVDGEAEASVVLPLGLAHGMAADMDDNAPWNAGDIMGKTGVGYPGWGAAPDAPAGAGAPDAAAGSGFGFVRPASAMAAQNVSGSGGSGLFNNFQVPFGSNITVTVEMVGERGHLVIFWMVLRGRTHASTLHMPGTPSVLLPSTARLRTYYTPNATLQPLQELAMYNTSSKNGAVLMVTVAVNSAPSNVFPAYHYLEGCMRAYSTNGKYRFRISSGYAYVLHPRGRGGINSVLLRQSTRSTGIDDVVLCVYIFFFPPFLLHCILLLTRCLRVCARLHGATNVTQLYQDGRLFLGHILL